MLNNIFMRKKRWIKYGVIVFIFLSFPLKGEELIISKKESRAKRYFLDNGMRVVIDNTPYGEVVSLVLGVDTGSSREGKFLGSGISHFVEHMLFKGTKKRGVGEIDRTIKSLGGNINGHTTYDYTAYPITLPKEYWKEGIEILADVVMNSRFDVLEIEKERKVILKEIKLNNDNPWRRLYNLLLATTYTRHPYRYPIIGYASLLNQLTRRDLREYYKKKYIPNNIVLVVVGDVDKEEVLEFIKEEFANFRMQPYEAEAISREEQIVPREIEERYPTLLARLFMGFRGVSILNEDIFALDVLSIILGEGQSSRLYRKIYKEKRLVYSIDTFNITLKYGGIFGITALLEESNKDKLKKAIEEEIEKIKSKGIEEKELKKAKRKVISDYFFSRDHASSLAMDLATNELLTGDFKFSQKYVEGIKSVTKEDILRVANKYLQKNKLTIAWLLPSSNKENKEATIKQEKKEIEKITLKNGIRVLLREDKRQPIVFIRVAFKAGVIMENDFNNGISYLTSRMLIRGTSNRSADNIAEEVASWGARLDTFSGNNSLGISLDILYEDIEKALNLLKDITTNSSFPEEELAKEKEFVLSKIKTDKDNIFRVASKVLRDKLFGKHPYHLDYLGKEESLKRLRREELLSFYHQVCVPANMVIAIFGDIDIPKLKPILEKLWEDIPLQQEVKINPYTGPFPNFAQEVKLKMEKEQTIIMYGFRSVSFKDKDRYPLEVLNAILTSMGGRLYERIRDGLGEAYTLGGTSLPGWDTGYYYLYVVTTNQNIDKVKRIIKEEIKRLKKGIIDKKDIEEAKNYLIGNHKMELEANSSFAFSSALDELYGLGYDYYKDYAENIRKVSKDDIQRVANTYLEGKKGVKVIIGPLE